ncbi:MAG: hypothetical protein H6907_14155 [Hyphomicrobiales bacterium]|nr:hypothetical protein [Hyphomicrobiales bacterium]MCP5372864.1 hypothetical protein [Hyphomicrobiales bacterium]
MTSPRDRAGRLLGRLAPVVLALLVPAAAAADGGTSIVVSKQTCARIVRHHPAPGVEYRPGVDVRGKPVAPADLDGGSGVRLYETTVIDIGIDLAEKYGLGAGGKYTGEAKVGRVAVTPDGRVTFNGQPIDPAESEAIAKACRKAYGN